MEIRGVKFSYVWDQSGVRNFDGNGYPYHERLRRLRGFDFTGCTFVAKTTTWESRLGKVYGQPGNMPLLEDQMTPAESRPKCIYVTPMSWIRGVALNAVGLSGPGIMRLLEKGIWHHQKLPFQISVMSLAKERYDRLRELRNMVQAIKQFPSFSAKFGIQLNISCPNVEHEEDVDKTLDETRLSLAILRELGEGVPLIVKLDALFPVKAALAMQKDPNCDALCNSNTIKWDLIPESVRWKLFGTLKSPLAEFGGGGLSGARWLYGLVLQWVIDARKAGIEKPIIAGGGVLSVRDADLLMFRGASAVALGSVAFLRPWRVRKIIVRINTLGLRERVRHQSTVAL
jgi:dihydroorotate dehydrogenase (NAD+) catalytic subunit